MIEHLTLEDCRTTLANTYRYLRPNGTCRLVMPDLRRLVDGYLSRDDSAALWFMEASGLGLGRRPHGIPGLLRAYLGHSQHVWLWDYPSLESELRRVGFRQVRRAEFGDSADPAFKQVEDAERWQNSLGIECVK